LGVPPTDGEGDADLFPEWDSYLQLEKDGGSKSHDLIDVGDEEEEVEAEAEEQEEETADGGVEAEEAEANAAPVAADEADEPASPQTDTEV
jgi:coatomer subunit beta'